MAKTTKRKRQTRAAHVKRAPAVSLELPEQISPQPFKSLAQTALEQPVNEIAAEVGKKQSELTASDVLLYSTANLPHLYRKAAFDMWLAPFKAWQSMLSAAGMFNVYSSFYRSNGANGSHRVK